MLICTLCVQSVKELGIYDLPAVIDYVHMRTGVKPAYIGHSQGAGTSALPPGCIGPHKPLNPLTAVFLALSKGMRPDIGNKMSCFIALGPAVYAGPVLRSFPFSLMRKFRARAIWSFVFGGASGDRNESPHRKADFATSLRVYPDH